MLTATVKSVLGSRLFRMGPDKHMLKPYRIVIYNKKYFSRALIRTIIVFYRIQSCYSTQEKHCGNCNQTYIIPYLVAIGLQAVGNSKTAPAGPFDYMDLMFEKQDEIHSFANTGK